jgi:hypothetical protein
MKGTLVKVIAYEFLFDPSVDVAEPFDRTAPGKGQ